MSASGLESWWDRLAYHRWLVGDPSEPGVRVFRRVRRTIVVAILLANVVGAVVVACFAVWALPTPDGVDDDAEWINAAVAGAYLLVALIVGARWGTRRLSEGRHGIRHWLCEERQPTERERRRVLRAPAFIMVVQTTLWAGAVVLFTVLNATFSGLLALGVGLTVALGGLTTGAAGYLLAELALRPVLSRALASAGPDRRRTSGVAARWLLAWALGSGVPLVGLVLIGVVALTSVDLTETTLAITILALGTIGLVFGALLSLLAVYATAHPLQAIRRAVRRVREGDLDVDLPVWDSTEVGLLQAGFNEMVAGLRERERMRDLFGRQVGADVAQRALADDVRLGGEVREVAVLFVDLVGSTALAAERPADEIVALLNRFFGEVVDVVEDAGGWINKFQGDAALAVFGAPIAVDRPEERALRAARLLEERLRERVPELDAGIGVAAGRAVAGNVGAERRFEYTVIGDAVNEAARLTELAKHETPPVLASEAAVQRAGEEAGRWELGERVQLRGRSAATRLGRPRGAR